MKSNPFVSNNLLIIPANSYKAFIIGILFGKKYIYDLVKDNNPLDGDQNDVHNAKLFLQDILNQQTMIRALNKIEKSNISKLKPEVAVELGILLGKKEAIEFVLANNFNKNLIEEQWFIVADKIENFE